MCEYADDDRFHTSGWLWRKCSKAVSIVVHNLVWYKPLWAASTNALLWGSSFGNTSNILKKYKSKSKYYNLGNVQAKNRIELCFLFNLRQFGVWNGSVISKLSSIQFDVMHTSNNLLANAKKVYLSLLIHFFHSTVSTGTTHPNRYVRSNLALPK